MSSIPRRATDRSWKRRKLTEWPSLRGQAHLCACVWYIIGKPNPSELDVIDLGMGALDDNAGWVTRYYPGHEDDKMFLYLHAFYYVMTTMSTVGYGDICPKRTGEVIFAMIVQLLGCAIFGYVVGLMGTEVSGFDAHESPMNQKIDFMEALMDKHKINKEVRQRVRRQYTANKETAQMYLVQEILDDLPSQLRRDVTLSVFRRPATTYEMLAGFPQDYTGEMVTLMMPFHTIRGDRVYSIGAAADEVYFVDEGAVNIEWEDVRIPKKKRTPYQVITMEEGRALGDEGLLEVRKRIFFHRRFYKMPSFYQDRLGTNIGKAPSKERERCVFIHYRMALTRHSIVSPPRQRCPQHSSTLIDRPH